VRIAPILVAFALCSLAAQPAASTAQAPLRVCADPDYLPFSTRAGTGFENRIAQKLASVLGRSLQYTWAPTRSEGGFDEFVHSTLVARRCDVLVDVPYGMANVSTTRPYYTASYVFVFKRAAKYDLTSMDSPVLRKVRIGYEADTPAEGGLKLRALTPGNVPFEIADHAGESPSAMLQAIDKGKINVGITWEPAIGYFLRSRPGYQVVTVPNSRSQGSPEQYSFPMAMATRPDDRALNAQLNGAIQAHKNEFAAILRDYGVRFFQPGTGT